MSSIPSTFPIVDRAAEVQLVHELRTAALGGHGGVLLLSGDGGIGKTRLITEVASIARAAKWQVAIGRAYAVEAAIAYAPFADALEPLIAAIDQHVLTRITRGDRSVLTAIAPSLAAAGTEMSGAGLGVAEQRARLHTLIVQLIGKLAEREPLMLVIENLQWADASSIELFHFLARHADPHRIVVIGSWNETERELPPLLGTTIRSLRSLGVAREIHLEPLSLPAVRELLTRAFEITEAAIASFAERLHQVTQGNPLFIEQTLRDLVQRGELRRSGDVWVGWQLEQFVLPRTVRDVLRARIDRLSGNGRRVAEWVAIVGTEAEHDLILAIAGLGERELLDAIDELRVAGMLHERVEGAFVYLDLSHPLLRQALIELVGATRERTMHVTIANAIEMIAGQRATRAAETIAAHWRRADPHVEPARAIGWFIVAAEQAKSRLARHEAAELLRAALERADASPDSVSDVQRRELVDELSRLYRRLGENHKAIAMASRARDDAIARNDRIAIAVAERRIGLACEGLGRRREAIEHFDAGMNAAIEERDDILVARLRLAKGACLQALGQPEEAKKEVAAALHIAEKLDRVALLARAHRTLLMLHLWSGPAHRAWAHARSAVELAERSGERNVMWSAHWAAAVLAGLTSNATALQRHLGEASRLADELASPLLQLRTAEIAIEYRSGSGDWDRAIVDGERCIQIARSLEQTTMLARLLHWVGAVYLQRGDVITARRLIDEAWTVSGADQVDPSRPFEVHGVLPAHVARVAYLVAIGEYRHAIELGRRAVEIADRTGSIAWAVYRLFPAMAQAALASDDQETLAEVRRRLAHDAAWLGHPIGQAWVGIIDAEMALRGKDSATAVSLLQQAVAALEAVPYPYDAANARLRLAALHQQLGEDSEAAREAQAALQVFTSLGAVPPAEKARALLRTLGAHIPVARNATDAFSELTSREVEIVRLVAQRLSNKEIGTRLGISDRTVGTHLANIFGKSGIRDRTLLGDAAREQGLHKV